MNRSPVYWSEPRRQNTPPAWKVILFSKISDLEISGTNVPGLGDFRITPEAASSLRKKLNSVVWMSLPIPVVSALSGGGIIATWTSGNRLLEMTTYADGEIICEAMEDGRVKDALGEFDVPTAVRWLITPQRPVPVNAILR